MTKNTKISLEGFCIRVLHTSPGLFHIKKLKLENAEHMLRVWFLPGKLLNYN